MLLQLLFVESRDAAVVVAAASSTEELRVTLLVAVVIEAATGEGYRVTQLLLSVDECTGFRVPSLPPKYRVANHSIHRQRNLWTEQALISVVPCVFCLLCWFSLVWLFLPVERCCCTKVLSRLAVHGLNFLPHQTKSEIRKHTTKQRQREYD